MNLLTPKMKNKIKANIKSVEFGEKVEFLDTDKAFNETCPIEAPQIIHSRQRERLELGIR